MKEPQEIEELANRIDHEELWKRGPFARDDMTPEQRDRLDAAVYLRRYAHDRFTVLEGLKEGREYMRGFKLERYGMGTDRRGCGDREWHAAINEFSNSEHYAWTDKSRSRDYPWMMYLAKRVSDEVPRLILKFEQERRGMPDTYRHCSHDHHGSKLVDNHLKCALGKECRYADMERARLAQVPLVIGVDLDYSVPARPDGVGDVPAKPDRDTDGEVSAWTSRQLAAAKGQFGTGGVKGDGDAA